MQINLNSFEDMRSVQAACSLHIVIVSHDPPSKVAPILDILRDHASPVFGITVLTSDETPPGPSLRHDFVSFRHCPSQSIFQMRALIPALVGECDWVVILEDHNHPSEAWATTLPHVLTEQPTEVQLVIGTLTNRQSISSWCWANFIAVLGAHWHPVTLTPVEMLVFNTAIRRACLGYARLPFGAFENQLMPQLLGSAYVSDQIPVDHYQPTGFVKATLSHWRNGKTTGDIIRQREDSWLTSLMAHSAFTLSKRYLRITRGLRRNPNAKDLPSGTIERVFYLSVVHVAGAIYGGLFGAGRAPWKLE